MLLAPAGTARRRGGAVDGSRPSPPRPSPIGPTRRRRSPGATQRTGRGPRAIPPRWSRRAVTIAVDHRVTAVDGTTVDLVASSICVHGDTPGAAGMAGRCPRRRSRASGSRCGPSCRKHVVSTAAGYVGSVTALSWSTSASVRDAQALAAAIRNCSGLDRHRGRRGRVPVGRRRGRPVVADLDGLADELAGMPAPGRRHDVADERWRSRSGSTAPTSTRWPAWPR